MVRTGHWGPAAGTPTLPLAPMTNAMNAHRTRHAERPAPASVGGIRITGAVVGAAS